MSEELNVFIEETEVPIVEVVIEESISDAILYDEDDVVTEALDAYITMLESDDIDETFEENLSVLLYPYMESIAPIFDIKYGKTHHKTAQKQAGKNKAATDAYMDSMKAKGKAKRKTAKIAGFQKAVVGKAKAAREVPKGMLARLRKKVGNSKLVKGIQKGYGKAKTFATKKYAAMKGAVGAQMTRAKKIAGGGFMKGGKKATLAGANMSV